MIAIYAGTRINDLTDGLSGIIARLERQRSATDRALEALREVEDIEGEGPNAAPARRAAAKSPSKSAANRRSEGQRKRWAAKKTEGAAVELPDEPPTKSRITVEGRQKLAEAMKKRWAVKRAGGTTKKTKAARK